MCCFCQIITTDEAEKRGHIYDREGSTYLFDLDYVEDVYTVDAAHQGNVSHFVNHSVGILSDGFLCFLLNCNRGQHFDSYVDITCITFTSFVVFVV